MMLCLVAEWPGQWHCPSSSPGHMWWCSPSSQSLCQGCWHWGTLPGGWTVAVFLGDGWWCSPSNQSLCQGCWHWGTLPGGNLENLFLQPLFQRVCAVSSGSLMTGTGSLGSVVCVCTTKPWLVAMGNKECSVKFWTSIGKVINTLLLPIKEKLNRRRK